MLEPANAVERAHRSPNGYGRMSKERQGTLLVVEDEPELRFILSIHLRAVGFEVLEASTGREGVRCAIERLPDVIIMDVGLPEMDGLSATRALRADERTAHIPVIMLTARSSSDDVVRGLEAGAQEYIAKPFDVTELLARVRTVHHLATTRGDLDRLNAKLEAEVDVKTQRLRLLYEFMRDLNHNAGRDEILDRIIACVQEITGARRISLLLKEPDSENLICERAVGIDPKIANQIRVGGVEGIAGQVYRSGKTLAAMAYGSSLDPERAYLSDAFLSTPLVSTSLETREGIIGVLNVTERPDNEPFAEEEIDFIRSIADAAAIALDNIVRRNRLEQSVRVLLQTVGELAEYRDEETTQHLERVTEMARVFAVEVGSTGPYADVVDEEFIDSLVQAAPMHDIGKVGIPDDILTKPGTLTAEEFHIMKTHTDIGRRVLSRALSPGDHVPLLQMCIDIAYCHHERWDGRGYPRRIAGEQIPLAARMIALVDAYDAITSQRRYKAAKSHEEAVEIIRAEAGHHFDPNLVDSFLRCQERFEKIRMRLDDAGVPAGVSA